MCVIREDWKEVVLVKMCGRKDWWPVLHFTGFQANKDLEEQPELTEVKASLAEILCPGMLVCASDQSISITFSV